MTDHFALLDEPRRPWLDAEAVRAKFLARSAEVHPDRFHAAAEDERLAATNRFAALNAAHQCLREPRERLRHLLELESGVAPADTQRIPAEMMDLFMTVGQLCREVDQFLAERARVTSPLLKVQWFARGMEWTDRLNALQQQLNARRDGLISELQTLNAAWATAPTLGSPERRAALPLERLEQAYRAFSYLTRWTGQLQERVVQLSLGTI